MNSQNNPKHHGISSRRRHSETDVTWRDRFWLPTTDDLHTSLPISLRHEIRNQERASELQLRWNEGIAENIGFSDGYDQIAVLIIKWHDDLDSLNTRQEVDELENVFRNDFNYITTKIDLHVDKPPQQQLNSAMANFVLEFDGPRNLLIVYYTGHSQYREISKNDGVDDGLLEFFADQVPRSAESREAIGRRGKEPARAMWHQAEKSLLEGLRADALAILDTCFAARAHKSVMEGDRAYQLLAACGHSMVTSGPGQNSFTAALIKALRELRELGRPFTTYKLCERINEHPPRHKSPSHVYNRLKQNDRFIALSPLDSSETTREQRTKRVNNEQLIASFLTLRFAFGEDCRILKDAHVDALTKYLPEACKRAGMDLHDIEFKDFRQREQNLRISAKVGPGVPRFQPLGRLRTDTSLLNETLSPLEEVSGAKRESM